MAQLDPVKIPLGETIDLYAATGITVGNKILVRNIGDNECNLYDSATTPSIEDGHDVISPKGEYGSYLVPNGTLSGCYAISQLGTVLQVDEVV